MASSKSVEKSSRLAFLGLKRLLNGAGCGTITGWTATQIGRCCVRGIGSRTDFSHISEMFEDTKMRSGLYPFFHIALLNDFGKFNRASIAGGGRGRHNLHRVCRTIVTAPPRVACVFWSHLISVCMFIVSKALLISSDCSRRGAIWLNPFATVLFSVCSVVTVECCVLYPCCMGVFGLLLCKEEGSSPVSLQLLRGEIWACMRCHCLSLCLVL